MSYTGQEKEQVLKLFDYLESVGEYFNERTITC